jgi:hypothetical protein
MADFDVKMPRNLTEQEADKLRNAGIAYAEAVYPDSGEPSLPLRMIYVRYVTDEQDAKRRAVEILGLTEQEAASLTVRRVAERSD